MLLGEQRWGVSKQTWRLRGSERASSRVHELLAMTVDGRTCPGAGDLLVRTGEEPRTKCAEAPEERDVPHVEPLQEIARNLWRFAAVKIRNLLGGPIQTLVQKQGIVKNEEQSVEKLLR